MTKLQGKAKYHYDKRTRSLPILEKGDQVMFQKNPGETWEPAKILSRHNERSYETQTNDGAIYRRNRVFINKSKSSSQRLKSKNADNLPLRTSEYDLACGKNINVTRSGREIKVPRKYCGSDWHT